jgi:hypothetical protein
LLEDFGFICHALFDEQAGDYASPILPIPGQGLLATASFKKADYDNESPNDP